MKKISFLILALTCASLSFSQRDSTMHGVVIIKTYSGDSFSGEFISATDTTATYRTGIGIITLAKKLISSVEGTGSQTAIPKSDVSGNVDDLGLQQEQRQEFNRRKMNIELVGVSLGTQNAGFGYSIYKDWHKWAAYEGFSPISEDQFFRQTGYSTEAQKAMEFRTSNNATTGILLTILGSGLLIAGYSQKETVEIGSSSIDVAKPNTTMIVAGYVAAGIGAGLILSGRTKENSNWAPFSTVQGIAEQYNQKLLVAICSGNATPVVADLDSSSHVLDMPKRAFITLRNDNSYDVMVLRENSKSYMVHEMGSSDEETFLITKKDIRLIRWIK